MRLKKKVLDKITDKKIRAKLCLALNVTDQSIVKYIGSNKDNGPLTTMAAISVIEKETGLDLSEILEEEVKEAEIAA